MFKLNVHLISLLNSMGLSKKNLGKLNTFIKNNNLVSKNNSIENPQESHNPSKVEEPSKIFYSIIDNSDNINSTKTNTSENLSTEEELYDEFNYLLDE